jgi:uncharacterized membrane protein YdjX (TVP38/TMEM64 family)
MKPETPPHKDWWKAILLLFLLAMVLAAFNLLHISNQLTSLGDWIKSLGVWGPIVFTLIYVLWVVAALPVTLFAFLAGILFGTVVGVVVSNIGVTLGACLAFLIARYFARGSVNRFLWKYDKFKKLDQWTAANGIWIVILTRLFPVLPFNLLNYAFGLTRIDFWPYAFWSWLCMIPAIIVYVAGAEAIHQGLDQHRVPWGLVGLVVIVAVLLLGLSMVLRKRVRKLG